MPAKEHTEIYETPGGKSWLIDNYKPDGSHYQTGMNAGIIKDKTGHEVDIKTRADVIAFYKENKDDTAITSRTAQLKPADGKQEPITAAVA